MDKKKYLEKIEEVINKGPFHDSWESLCNYRTAEWYKKSKFGIFIHWGVFSVPAFKDEWYPRRMYQKDSEVYHYHREKYGDQKEFGYKDLIPMFRAEKFDAEEWADLFEKSGAKFVMPVAEHHDGFQMYDSDLSDWNAKKMGPKRDVLGEIKSAVEKRNMKFCASSHRAEHWWFFCGGREFDSDVLDEKYRDFYGPARGPLYDLSDLYENQPDQEYLEDWLVRICEIVDKYQPRIIFFDWWIQNIAFKPYLQKFAAYYYNRAAEWGVEVAIDAKFDAYAIGSAVKDIERGQLSNVSPEFWQNDTSVAKNSWCYTENNEYKTSRSIVCDLVDVVSKNGALLLNIGPKADGTIPDEDKKILTEVGEWLKVNGECIYDTLPWRVYGEGPTLVPEGTFTDTDRSDFTSEDIRYTTKNNCIYAVVMKWPESGKVKLSECGKKSSYLHAAIKQVTILGKNLAPHIELRDELEVYAKLETDDMPVVIKIELL